MLCCKFSLLNLTSQHMARSLVVVWMVLRRKVVLGATKQICKTSALSYLGECKFVCTLLVNLCCLVTYHNIFSIIAVCFSQFIFKSKLNNFLVAMVQCKKLYCVCYVSICCCFYFLWSFLFLTGCCWYMELIYRSCQPEGMSTTNLSLVSQGLL